MGRILIIAMAALILWGCQTSINQPFSGATTEVNTQPSSIKALQRGPQILVMGTHHFDPDGSDVLNLDVGDVLSEKRQSEILQLVDALKVFAPTKIAIELQPQFGETFNQTYAEYRDGAHALTRNERQQVAMRLAAMLGHDKLYAVDASTPFDSSGLPAAAEEAGETEILTHIFAELAPALLADVQAIENDPDQTIIDLFRYLNSGWHDRNQQLYGQLARIGTPQNPAGAELAAQWERRNILIAANIDALIEGPEERVLVLFGAAHRVPIERSLRDMGTARLLDPLDFLPQ